MTTVVRIMLIDDDPAEEMIFRAQMKKVVNYDIEMSYAAGIEKAVEMFLSGVAVDMVLLDNRLGPGEDFRESAPKLRQSGYIGPIGVISSSLTDPYFQAFQEYGADFRIDKAEFDPTAIGFLIQEYTKR
jgi:CheY-like chemotaxis protein